MFDGFSLWHLLILFLIIVLVFGSKKLVSLGPDLGKALRGFKQAMHGEEVSPQSGKNATGDEKRDAARAAEPGEHDLAQQNRDSET